MREPAAPASKPRRRRKEARPGEIIAAAMALWAERGFAATRLDDVAKRAGVAKGTIYLYFASKEDLFAAALRDRLLGVIDNAQPALASGDLPTKALLHALLSAMKRRLIDEGAVVLFRVLLGEGGRFPDLVEIYRTTMLERGFQTVSALMARGVARGELKPEAAAIDPRIVVSPVLMGALTQNLMAGNLPDVDERYIDAIVDGLLDGLAIDR